MLRSQSLRALLSLEPNVLGLLQAAAGCEAAAALGRPPPAGAAARRARGLAADAAEAPPAAAAPPAAVAALAHVRNLGISAHIDSGKTTLTERILFYTGRIHAIHEVRGRDGVGAKMDSMELEREKGITIQSAATYCRWGSTDINIIDTPGHVDFTIEVERALRVLDGAVLVLCGVGGVQSQSITVDRQMRRYDVPRLAFVNKLDRPGADAAKVVRQLRQKLRLNAAPVQVPLGAEDALRGLVDVVEGKAYAFEGASGERVVEVPVPAEAAGAVADARRELVERVAEVDEPLAELFLAEEPVDAAALRAAVRRATLALRFVPVFMGSAFKNKGVQLLLDGARDYLPAPTDVANWALDQAAGEARVPLPCDPAGPLVALAFKLEEGRFGQLTYVRVYSGTLRKGDYVVNQATGKRVKVPRLVRMHADELEDVAEARAGGIAAMFGVECASGDTFTDGARLTMTSMAVPEPVMSLALAPRGRDGAAAFGKALARFAREDPTFRVASDAESGQTVVSGMGELHLEVYVERMRREYGVDVEAGRPRVNYREAVTRRAPFDYLHKKQSGGSGQYGRVAGYIEPLEDGEGGEDGEAGGGGGAAAKAAAAGGGRFEFVNGIVGNAIPPGFVPAIEKGFREAAASGALTGHPVDGVRVVLTDGAAHAVDSSELAFRLAALYAFRAAYRAAAPTVLEPVMAVEVVAPAEFQGAVVGDLARRRGAVVAAEQDGDDAVLAARVPLGDMFGYSTALRSMTQGKGEFSMEYAAHAPVPPDALAELTARYAAARSAAEKK